jgi:single-strand DNA-binding protein
LVIAQVGDRPGPKKQLDISNEKENSMAERSVNKAILLGRLGSDAETRFTQNGTPVSRVSLAMNRQWTDSDKQVHEETDWMSIVIWNKENLATYLTKGTKLYVEGRLQTRSYDDKEGVKRYVTEVVAENLVLLGGVATATVTAMEEARRKRRVAARPVASLRLAIAIGNQSPKSKASKTTTYRSDSGILGSVQFSLGSCLFPDSYEICCWASRIA